jgi:hypothetical protein
MIVIVKAEQWYVGREGWWILQESYVSEVRARTVPQVAYVLEQSEMLLFTSCTGAAVGQENGGGGVAAARQLNVAPLTLCHIPPVPHDSGEGSNSRYSVPVLMSVPSP